MVEEKKSEVQWMSLALVGRKGKICALINPHKLMMYFHSTHLSSLSVRVPSVKKDLVGWY